MATLVLPGDEIPPHALPTGTGKRKTLKLGPGLRHIPPSTVVTTVAGALVTDNKKNAASVETNSGRVSHCLPQNCPRSPYLHMQQPLHYASKLTPLQYTPYPNDLVIATINNSTGESFNCLLSPHTPFAALPHLAFEGATKKTRPQLPPNSLIYTRIVSCPRDSAPELTCVDPATGKSEGLGLLKGGMVFPISLGMARRLLAPREELVLLEELGKKIGFEVTVGRNGVVHVDAGSVGKTLAVGRALQRVDVEAVGEAGQRKMVGEILKKI